MWSELLYYTCDQPHVLILTKKCRQKEKQLLYFGELSKAANHKILLQELKTQFGIRGTPLKIFKNFLSEGQQYLKFGGKIQSTSVNRTPFNRTPKPSHTNCQGTKFLQCNVLCFISVIGQPRYPTMTAKF